MAMAMPMPSDLLGHFLFALITYFQDTPKPSHVRPQPKLADIINVPDKIHLHDPVMHAVLTREHRKQMAERIRSRIKYASRRSKIA